MFNRIVLNLAVSFCLRQLAKFGAETDWEKVKADFDERVKNLVPGDFFDAEAVHALNATVDAVALVCKDTADLQVITTALAAKDWEGARKSVQTLMAKVAGPDLVQTLLAA